MDKVESLYIHFPLCRHLCNYCDFYKTAPSAMERASRIIEFHEYLSKSFSQLNKLMKDSGAAWSDLSTLYVGGGTPSLWDKEGAEFLNNFLDKNQISLADDCEATLEVNPGTWTDQGLEAFSKVGFNRFSLGVQSTRNEFLEKLDRVHRKEEVFETLKKFNSMRVNYSVDFMLGLPFSKELDRNISEELEEILSYRPSHLSLYILTVKDNYTHYKNLPDEEWIEREFLEVSDLLKSKGFEHYEVSNFALKGKKSRHNSKYWSGDSIAALGPSATGYFSESRQRFKWKPLEPNYQIEKLTEAEVKMEKFYLNLRTSAGLSLNQFFDGQDLLAAKGLARKWSSDGLCKTDDEALVLTPRGYLVMDSLIDEVFTRTKTL